MTQESGFEFGGRFYPWHLTDRGKDLLIIDRLTGLPPQEFFQVVEDDHDRSRGPIMLALVATSLRNGNPEWSVERVLRTVNDLSLSEVEFVAGDEEEVEEGVPLDPKTSTGKTESDADASPPSSGRSRPTPAATSGT